MYTDHMDAPKDGGALVHVGFHTLVGVNLSLIASFDKMNSGIVDVLILLGH